MKDQSPISPVESRRTLGKNWTGAGQDEELGLGATSSVGFQPALREVSSQDMKMPVQR